MNRKINLLKKLMHKCISFLSSKLKEIVDKLIKLATYNIKKQLKYILKLFDTLNGIKAVNKIEKEVCIC